MKQVTATFTGGNFLKKTFDLVIIHKRKKIRENRQQKILITSTKIA